MVPSNNNIIIIVVVVLGVLGLIILLIVAWNSGKSNGKTPTSHQDNLIEQIDEDDDDDDDDSFESGSSTHAYPSTLVPPKNIKSGPAPSVHIDKGLVYVPKVGTNIQIPKQVITPSPKMPFPKAPSPKAPSPKAPSPKAPSPKVSSPKVSSPKVPSPKGPSPKASSPKAPSPKAPSPKASSPKVPSPKVGTASDNVKIPKVEMNLDGSKSISASDNSASVVSGCSESESESSRCSNSEDSVSLPSSSVNSNSVSLSSTNSSYIDSKVMDSSNETSNQTSSSYQIESESFVVPTGSSTKSLVSEPSKEDLASVEGIEMTLSDRLSSEENIIQYMNPSKNRIATELPRPAQLILPYIPTPYIPSISGNSDSKSNYFDETSGRTIDVSMSNPGSFSSDFSTPTEVSTVKTQRRKQPQNHLRGIANIGKNRRGRGRSIS